MKCPECGREMLKNGVMLVGNILTGEKAHPMQRLDCPDCEVIVSTDIDPEDGWKQWKEQNQKGKVQL